MRNLIVDYVSSTTTVVAIKDNLFGYEIKVPSHALPEGCQQQCSYGIDHMDAPI